MRRKGVATTSSVPLLGETIGENLRRTVERRGDREALVVAHQGYRASTMGRMRRTIMLDAPTNLGLRPPVPGAVPGCYKAPWALRDQGLLDRLGAADAGVVVPPRYDRDGWRPGDGVFNAPAIATYSRRLADRLAPCVDRGDFVLVLGGDCSVMLATTLALRRRGRWGLAFVDGHTDFRHPGNAVHVGAAAGEDLALVTGRGQEDLTDLDGLRPYVRDEDVVALGQRDDDDELASLRAEGLTCLPVSRVRELRPGGAAEAALVRLEAPELSGFWLHLDVDVLDARVMPAVDTPDPGGLDRDEVVALVAPLAASPRCAGMEVTIFDPDLDPDGHLAADLTDLLLAVLPTPG